MNNEKMPEKIHAIITPWNATEGMWFVPGDALDGGVPYILASTVEGDAKRLKARIKELEDEKEHPF